MGRNCHLVYVSCVLFPEAGPSSDDFLFFFIAQQLVY